MAKAALQWRIRRLALAGYFSAVAWLSGYRPWRVVALNRSNGPAVQSPMRPWRFRLVAGSVLAAALLHFSDIGDSQTPGDSGWSPRLILNVVDAASGEPLAARFTVTLDGAVHEPRWLGPHGLRFASVHVSKRQTQVFNYARGTGPVWVPLKAGAQHLRVDVAKGLDYLPVSIDTRVEGDPVDLTVGLERWNRLREDGWYPADAHLHYDRIEPDADRDWSAMMAGDDVWHAQFMVLKGGMVPGVWARQFAYGREGERSYSGKTIVAGQEYRDSLQGHILLFGVGEVIPPIMAGVADAPHNYPVFLDVLNRARNSGGLAGVAHGGTLSQSPTVLADTILGAVDFMEIANFGFWPLENWYRLMNCGYDLPPTAGTDLPNNPYREPWQPMLGGMRMYAQTSGVPGSEAWNRAVRNGRTLVTSGPIIELDANGLGPGETLCVAPESDRKVRIKLRMRSPRKLDKLELLLNGEVVASSSEARIDGSIHEIAVDSTVRFEESAWIAGRGRGAPSSLPGGSSVAHTAAIRVLVGGTPIWSDRDATTVITQLQAQRAFYARNGSYSKAADRTSMLAVFERAISTLTSNLRAAAESTDGCDPS